MVMVGRRMGCWMSQQTIDRMAYSLVKGNWAARERANSERLGGIWAKLPLDWVPPRRNREECLGAGIRGGCVDA